MDIEAVIHDIQKDLITVHDRLGKVEDKAAGAWNTIREINADVSRLREDVKGLRRDLVSLTDRFTKMEADVKEQKQTIKTMSVLVKVLIGISVFTSVVSIGFFIYIWRHDAELAKGLLTLGSAVTGVIV